MSKFLDHLTLGGKVNRDKTFGKDAEVIFDLISF